LTSLIKCDPTPGDTVMFKTGANWIMHLSIPRTVPVELSRWWYVVGKCEREFWLIIAIFEHENGSALYVISPNRTPGYVMSAGNFLKYGVIL